MIKIDSRKIDIDVDKSMKFFYDMSDKGLKVKDNTDIIKILSNKRDEKSAELLNKYGISKPKSIIQIDSLLYKEVISEHKSVIYKNGKKRYSMDVMRALSELGYTWAMYFVELNEIVPMLNHYSDIQNHSREGLIHPEISIAKSGRVNYKKPGLMNITISVLWDSILPKSDDFEMYSVDIKSQEPLILISMMNITELREKILDSRENDSSKGVYEIIFEYIFGYYPEETELLAFKVCWVALGYGGTKNGMRMLTEEIDTDAVCDYFKDIKGFKKYKAGVTKKIKNLDQKMTTYFGREVYANEVKKKLLNTMMNIGIQGTGVDILFILMNSIENRLKEDNLQDKISLYFTRHDELIFNVHKSLEDSFVKQYLKDNLEHQIDDWIPFEVKVNKII